MQMVERSHDPSFINWGPGLTNVPVLNRIRMLPNLAKLLLVASFFVIFHWNFLLFGLVRCIIHSHLYLKGILQPQKHGGKPGQWRCASPSHACWSLQFHREHRPCLCCSLISTMLMLSHSNSSWLTTAREFRWRKPEGEREAETCLCFPWNLLLARVLWRFAYKGWADCNWMSHCGWLWDSPELGWHGSSALSADRVQEIRWRVTLGFANEGRIEGNRSAFGKGPAWLPERFILTPSSWQAMFVD